MRNSILVLTLAALASTFAAGCVPNVAAQSSASSPRTYPYLAVFEPTVTEHK